MNTYRVTATPKHPAWDEKNGWTLEISARTKREAIKYAKAEIRRAGHDGVIYFKAEEVAS